MDNKNKEFKQLQKHWYRKLKKSGFEDAENDKEYLINHSGKYFRQKMNDTYYNDRVVLHESREEYYRRAGHFLYDHVFESKFDRTVWQLHSEGLAIRDIAERTKTYRDRIHKIIKKYKQIMLKEI